MRRESNETTAPTVRDSLPKPRWLSPERPPPRSFVEVGDETTARAALSSARSGEGLLYRGGYHGARQLLAAMGRRLISSRGPEKAKPSSEKRLGAIFRAERERARMEHEVLSRLAVPLGEGYRVLLRGAPDVRAACAEALGQVALPGALPLRDLLGMLGAHEWRRRGVFVPALGARVHPWYGVYAPVRGEYVDLVARAASAFPVLGKRAIDVGTGTGVLAFVLARMGATVVATDTEPRAVLCAKENAARLHLSGQVEVRQKDLFPEEPADLVVANPPWLPAEAHGPLERAVYDPGGAVLESLVLGLPGALRAGGEAWLVLSDLAERLGLRKRGYLEELVAKAGLAVAGALETRASHPRARDRDDPLNVARAAEVVRLFRLVRG